MYACSLFADVCAFISNVGQRMLLKDQYVPFALFADFALGKLCSLMRAQPRKVCWSSYRASHWNVYHDNQMFWSWCVAQVSALAPLIYSFSIADADEHLKVIRRIHELMDDMSLFLHVCSVLVELENEIKYTITCASGVILLLLEPAFFSVMCIILTWLSCSCFEKLFDSDKLMDLYTYYCLIGLHSSSPFLRAASLLTFGVLAPHDTEHKFVLNMLRMCPLF